MRFDWRFIFAAGNCIPLKLGHRLIKPGEYDLTARQPGNAFHQRSNCGCGSANARRNNKARRRRFAPARGGLAKLAVAPIRKINPPERGQFSRPSVNYDVKRSE